MSLLAQIKEGIVEGDSVAGLVEQALAEEKADKVLTEAVIAGIQRAGELWQEGKYFLPDVILAADSFKEAMAVVEPKLSGKGAAKVGKVLIGVVEGDMHDLGKSIVIAMLTSGGFEVIDLGCDVSAATFVEKVKEHQPDILGLGAYMSTTMLQMKDVIEALKEAGLREDLKVMAGGVPITAKYAEEVGADGWGSDALHALTNAKTLLGVE